VIVAPVKKRNNIKTLGGFRFYCIPDTGQNDFTNVMSTENQSNNLFGFVCMATQQHMQQFGIQYCGLECTKHHPYHNISASPGEAVLVFSSVNTPGALCLARWMAMLLCAIKIELLRSQISSLFPKGIVFASGQPRHECFCSV